MNSFNAKACLNNLKRMSYLFCSIVHRLFVAVLFLGIYASTAVDASPVILGFHGQVLNSTFVQSGVAAGGYISVDFEGVDPSQTVGVIGSNGYWLARSAGGASLFGVTLWIDGLSYTSEDGGGPQDSSLIQGTPWLPSEWLAFSTHYLSSAQKVVAMGRFETDSSGPAWTSDGMLCINGDRSCASDYYSPTSEGMAWVRFEWYEGDVLTNSVLVDVTEIGPNIEAPIPGSGLLLGSGFLGAAGLLRRQKIYN